MRFEQIEIVLHDDGNISLSQDDPMNDGSSIIFPVEQWRIIKSEIDKQVKEYERG